MGSLIAYGIRNTNRTFQEVNIPNNCYLKYNIVIKLYKL